MKIETFDIMHNINIILLFVHKFYMNTVCYKYSYQCFDDLKLLEISHSRVMRTARAASVNFGI